jgi:hypothetical protein
MTFRTLIVLIGLAAATPALAQRAQPLPNPAPRIPQAYAVDPDNPLNYPPPPPAAPRRVVTPDAFAPDHGRPFIPLNSGRLCQRQGQILVCY